MEIKSYVDSYLKVLNNVKSFLIELNEDLKALQNLNLTVEASHNLSLLQKQTFYEITIVSQKIHDKIFRTYRKFFNDAIYILKRVAFIFNENLPEGIKKIFSNSLKECFAFQYIASDVKRWNFFKNYIINFVKENVSNEDNIKEFLKNLEVFNDDIIEKMHFYMELKK